jgi:hypothetical protein
VDSWCCGALTPLEYAVYTVANATVGALIAIADSGVTAGVLSLGGRVFGDRAALGVVLCSGLRVRRRILIPMLGVATIVVSVVTVRLGIPPGAAVLIALSALPSIWLNSTSQILEIVPRLFQEVRNLQGLQVLNNVARLACLVLVLPVLPMAWAAIAVTAVPQAWFIARLRSLTRKHAQLEAAPDPAVVGDLRRRVARTLPTAVYFALSGQLAIGLVSILGTARQVASVGALGRLSMVLVAVGSAFGVLVVPRYARLVAERAEAVRRWFWGAQGLLLGLCALVVGGVAVFQDAIVWVLGPAYAGLGPEAVLMAINGGLWVMAGGVLALSTARGVVTPYWLLIPTSLTVELAAIVLLPVGTVRGSIYLSALTGLNQWVVYLGYFVWTMRPRRAQ